MQVKTATFIFSSLIFGLFMLLGISLAKITALLDREAKDLAMASESTRVAKELKSHLLIHNRNSFLYSLDQDPRRWESGKELRARIGELLATMNGLMKSEEEKSVLAGLQTNIESYLEKRRLLDAMDLPAIRKYSEISKDVDITLAVVDRLIEVNMSQMEMLLENIESQNKIADRLGLLLLASAGIVLLGLIGIMFVYIVRPLRNVATAITEFGSEATAVRVEPRGLEEIRQIASNFNSLADLLEEKQKEQLRFIAAIAHELRNPLNSMSMASGLLVRNSGPEDRKMANIILRQVKNLDRLVGDLLDTTRIESGHIDLRFSSHNINSLIEDCVHLHRGAADLHRFDVEVPDKHLFCECDGGRISQVLNNLLSNAIKYSPNGGPVTIKARRERDEIVVSVTDRGIGIAPEDLENIFRPFHRTKATRATIPGIGLGLSASRHIVEAHGGKLKVQSQAGAGSTFYFSLPARNVGRNASYDEPQKIDHANNPSGEARVLPVRNSEPDHLHDRR